MSSRDLILPSDRGSSLDPTRHLIINGARTLGVAAALSSGLWQQSQIDRLPFHEPVHSRNPLRGEAPADSLPLAASISGVSRQLGRDLHQLSDDGRYEWVEYRSSADHVCIRAIRDVDNHSTGLYSQFGELTASTVRLQRKTAEEWWLKKGYTPVPESDDATIEVVRSFAMPEHATLPDGTTWRACFYVELSTGKQGYVFERNGEQWGQVQAPCDMDGKPRDLLLLALEAGVLTSHAYDALLANYIENNGGQ